MLKKHSSSIEGDSDHRTLSDHGDNQLLVDDHSEGDDSDMSEDELEEFCESSWESDPEEVKEEDKMKLKQPDRKASSSFNINDLDSSSEEDANSENMSQNAWEIREETEYKKEKASYRDYLRNEILAMHEGEHDHLSTPERNKATEHYEK